jgi:hypothetical protein
MAARPIERAMDALIRDQEHRHAWLFGAAEQCRKWREQDARNSEEAR